MKLPDEVIVPSAVVEEIQAGQSDDPAQVALASGKFPVSTIPVLPEILAWDLGIVKQQSCLMHLATRVGLPSSMTGLPVNAR